MLNYQRVHVSNFSNVLVDVVGDYELTYGRKTVFNLVQ